MAASNPGEQGKRWALARDLCERALELEPSQREQFLDDACGGDIAVRDQALGLIRSQTAAVFEPLQPGRQISHYRIEDRIGEGGMGTVYRATDLTLGRSVALKVLSRGRSAGVDQQRFIREAKAASSLNHANIVTVYEFGSDAGISFLAMELVDGKTLGKVLAGRSDPGGEVPLGTLLAYARQVVSALAKAHAAGITHRDLKPGNIMITADGVAKVLDFGLAKQEIEISQADVTVTALTQSGSILGTPAYMSPEQAKSEPVTHRSDIFSFGIILYEIVCGFRPFRGNDPLSVLSQIITQDPLPVSQVNPSAPPEVVSLIEACLQKDPARRIASMNDVLAMLGGTATLPAVPTAAVSRRPTRRWIGAAAGITGITAALLIARSAYLKWEAGASVLTIFRADSFALFEKASALLAKKYRRQYLDEAIRLLEQSIETNPGHAASYAALAEAYVARNQAQFDQEWTKRALEVARRAVELSPDLASAQIALGMALSPREGPEAAAEAEAVLRRAIELAPNNSQAHRWLGTILTRKNQFAEAEAELMTAVRLEPGGWDAHAQLGTFRFRRQRFTEAAEVWQAAAKNSPDNPLIHRNLAAAYHMLGRLDHSAESLQRALEVEPAAAVYSNLGTLRFFQGKYRDSLAAFEKAVEMNPSHYLYWGNLADAYRWTPGERSKAAGAYEKAIQLGGPVAARDKAVQGRLALYKVKKGDPISALAAIDALRGSPWDGSMHYRAAVVLEISGRRKQALDELQASLAKGYALSEISNDPELVSLRSDPRYHRLALPGTAQPAVR